MMRQLYHNEDCSQFFYFRDIPAGQAGEVIDRYVDVMADAGVTTFLLNTNARRTNYRSRVWDSAWDGYAPSGPDDQPFLAPIQGGDKEYGVGVALYRKLLDNMLAVYRQGIDFPARVIRRCRERGMSPWVSLRMNDAHFDDHMAHPSHGRFWRDNPQFIRKDARGGVPHGGFSRTLDYAHPEVREYFMALIVETLDRYDIDGLELDFMRERYLFSEGKEAEGAGILTGWLRAVRRQVVAAGVKRGHPVRLGVRVPSHPKAATGWGLDVGTWIHEGLIDLLVPTPRYHTLEFDMPLRQWREMRGASNVTLAGGLEVNYRPFLDGQTWEMKDTAVSPELARGAAILVLSQGADAVYLFNYFQPFWGQSEYQHTLNAMASLDALKKQTRTIGISFRDILAPGEAYRAPLPATGHELVFSMNLGPIPDSRWTCELLIGLERSENMPCPLASIDGTSCALLGDRMTDKLPPRLVTFKVPMAALAGAEPHAIKIVSQGQDALTIKRVEVSFKEPYEFTKR